MEEEVKKYYRPITHQGYKYTNKIADFGEESWLPKQICEKFFAPKREAFIYASDCFIYNKNAENMLLLLGGVALFIALPGVKDWYCSGALNGFEKVVVCVCSFLALWFTVYYFTMPQKEIIFNRMDGTITFPGWHWNKNITMHFDDIKFGYTTGGPNAVGAYKLQILRPDRFGSWQFFPIGGITCYEALSFITWYMDKNRPLPPGEAFDAFRQKDFERRKAEGFPKPLYYSSLPTPEATPKQQKEREKHWRG